MTSVTTGIAKIAHHLLLLNQQLATGELVVRHGKQTSLQWKVYFYLGRVVYATGGIHPVRRWYRAFKYNCAECFSANWLIQAYSELDLWEVDLLNQALNQGRINQNQYKAVIQTIVQEVMFTLLGQKFFTTEWHPGVVAPQSNIYLSVDQLVQDGQKLREQWRNCGLGFLQELMTHFSPDLAPVLKNRLQMESHLASPAHRSMVRMMRGEHTLWDIAQEMHRPLPVIVRSILPRIRHGIIDLREIPDFPALCVQSVALPVVTPPPAKLVIACIDSNLSTGRMIAQALQPHYEVITILNPLRGLPTLLERKPKLIFLDPKLAETNGYELCALLRKTTELQDIPIVILAKQDGMIDRVRAKLSGASEFLTKPTEAEKVQQVVQKYLRPANSSAKTTSASNWVVA